MNPNVLLISALGKYRGKTKLLPPLRSPCLYESFVRSFHASSVRDVVFIAGLV